MADAGEVQRAAERGNGGPGSTGSFGPNAWLVDDMYDRYVVDPSSVSESWREFFSDYRPAPTAAAGSPA
jgi:2-oxoglutarate dehydrogenase complex dehydrogenase (E1) component-like enzyme